MEYKKTLGYRIGFGITVLAIVLLIFTFVLMGFGFDGAIPWFFIGCGVLLIGSFIITFVRHSYERKIYDEPSRFAILKDRISLVRKGFLKRGTLGAVLLTLVVGTTAVTLVMGVKAGVAAYEYAGVKNAGYEYNFNEYQKYKELRDKAVLEDDTVYAMHCETKMKYHLNESQWYYARTGVVREMLNEKLLYLYCAIAINVVTVVGYAVYVIRYRKKYKQEKSIE